MTLAEQPLRRARWTWAMPSGHGDRTCARGAYRVVVGAEVDVP